ncbi:hypothetical protein C0583_04770 [Candidatus Parcubacteria bacterium]|nr:MAG: hypothetical protein C0583_04770 [Candidatus Parcubacteria bacterium]
MGEENIKYKYRKWPLLVPTYFLFAFLYFVLVYSFSEFTFRALADTLVMTLFVVTTPVLVFFDLKVVRIKSFVPLFLHIIYSWLIVSLLIYAILRTYLEAEEWFGAIALFFLLFIYNLFWLSSSAIVFLVKKKNIKKEKTLL